MKKSISIILALLTIISIPISIFATASDENQANTKSKKEIAEMFYEKYGEDGILQDDVKYVWNYNDVSDTSDSQVQPRWFINNETKVTHEMIIDEANSLAIDNGDAYIADRYLPLVKIVNKKCDATWNDTDTYGSMAHGKGNYLAALKYLWVFAKTIASCSASEITNSKIDSVSKEARLSLANGTETGLAINTNIKKLEKLAVYALKTYYKTTTTYTESQFNYKISEHTKPKRCKYILYGIITHVLADIYAHRVIVPHKAIQTISEGVSKSCDCSSIPYNNSINKQQYFNPADFENADKENLVNGVCEQIIQFQSVKDYVDEEDEATIRNNYIDNGNFYPARIDEAVYTTLYFIEYFSDGFDYYAVEPMHFTIGSLESYKNSIGVS